MSLEEVRKKQVYAEVSKMFVNEDLDHFTNTERECSCMTCRRIAAMLKYKEHEMFGHLVKECCQK